MPKLSVTVVAKNEAADLGAALASVTWADEIVVVDSHSTDETVAVARQFTDRVIVHDWLGHIEQKNYAASLASHDWILSIDADERVTPELASEIQSVMATDPRAVAFRLPRVTFHLGRWIRTTDWFPDYQHRLYDRRAARWTGRYVHEKLTVDGDTGALRGELQHYAYRDIADHVETIDRYTTYAARQMHEDGRRAGLLQLAAHPPLAFLRNYIARGGIRDGATGFIISSMNAYYVFLKFAKLWELNNRGELGRVRGSGFKVQGSFGSGVPGSADRVSTVGTQNPEPGTLNPEPRTRNPEPGTPNPEPGTRNLEP